MRNKTIGLLGLALAGLFLSGCGTFKGNQLPQQSTKPQLRKATYYFTEQVNFDATTAMCGTPEEFFVPRLRQVCADAGGTTNIAQEAAAVAQQMQTFNALPEHDRRIQIARKTTISTSNDGRPSVYRVEDLTGSMSIAQIEAIYKDRMVAKEKAAFAQKMRTDTRFREEMLATGMVWLDCKTSLVEGNASTWFLEGLLCSFSLTLFPAHHNKVLDVKISAYENGKLYQHEYKDSWNAVFWLPLFPVGLIQGSWPDAKTINSVLDNMATTALIDFQKDQAKE